MLRLVAAALLSLAAPLWLECQIPASHQVSGVVTDQTDAAIAAAEVVFSSGSFTTKQVTDNHGEFVFSQIPVESGTVTVSAPGFQARTVEWRSEGSGSTRQQSASNNAAACHCGTADYSHRKSYGCPAG